MEIFLHIDAKSDAGILALDGNTVELDAQQFRFDRVWANTPMELEALSQNEPEKIFLYTNYLSGEMQWSALTQLSGGDACFVGGAKVSEFDDPIQNQVVSVRQSRVLIATKMESLQGNDLEFAETYQLLEKLKRREDAIPGSAVVDRVVVVLKVSRQNGVQIKRVLELFSSLRTCCSKMARLKTLQAQLLESQRKVDELQGLLSSQSKQQVSGEKKDLLPQEKQQGADARQSRNKLTATVLVLEPEESVDDHPEQIQPQFTAEKEGVQQSKIRIDDIRAALPPEAQAVSAVSSAIEVGISARPEEASIGIDTALLRRVSESKSAQQDAEIDSLFASIHEAIKSSEASIAEEPNLDYTRSNAFTRIESAPAFSSKVNVGFYDGKPVRSILLLQEIQLALQRHKNLFETPTASAVCFAPKQLIQRPRKLVDAKAVHQIEVKPACIVPAQPQLPKQRNASNDRQNGLLAPRGQQPRPQPRDGAQAQRRIEREDQVQQISDIKQDLLAFRRAMNSRRPEPCRQ